MSLGRVNFQKASYANKASFGVGTPVRRLGIDVRLKLMDRLDFLELGYRTATWNKVRSTRQRSRPWRPCVMAERSTHLRTGRRWIELVRPHICWL